MDQPSLRRQSIRALGRLALGLAVLLFGPAGTLRYWQAWVFWLIFVASSAAITGYLYRHDPNLLAHRLRAGPTAEKEASQKVIMAFASLAFLALIVVPALDHRFGWSPLPPAAALVGDGLILLGNWIVFRVFQVNAFTAATIEVQADQRVITTGPYAIVRHPMYVGGLLMLLGMPLALGSGVGLLLFVPALAAIVWRLLDEEGYLSKHLAGYDAYRRQTRYRLIPHVW